MLSQLYDKLFPDNKPENIRRWRMVVSQVILVISACVSYLFFAVTSGVPFAGRLAWGSDVEIKIKDATKPIEDRLTKVETAVAKQTDTSNSLLAKLAADQIDFLVARRCKSNDPEEIRYLTREIGKYSDDYSDAKQKSYLIPTCQDVGYKGAGK